MATVITSPFDPTPEVQSEEGMRNYFSKLADLARTDFCAELSNVMAAKHNHMLAPTGIDSMLEKQEIVTDLVNKAIAICIQEFGQTKVLGYGDGEDLTPFNELVNAIDEKVAQHDMDPDQHGSIMLRELKDYL